MRQFAISNVSQFYELDSFNFSQCFISRRSTLWPQRIQSIWACVLAPAPEQCQMDRARLLELASRHQPRPRPSPMHWARLQGSSRRRNQAHHTLQPQYPSSLLDCAEIHIYTNYCIPALLLATGFTREASPSKETHTSSNSIAVAQDFSNVVYGEAEHLGKWNTNL